MSPLVKDATGNDLTYRIIGAAMAVHNKLGPGYKEEVYEKALATEVADSGIEAQSQYPVEVYYSDAIAGLFYLDLYVENQVVVEVKALSHLVIVHIYVLPPPVLKIEFRKPPPVAVKTTCG